MLPIIEASAVSFRYPDGHLALQDVSFHLHAGEKVALLGANGAGKSTLLLALNGILRAEGRIRVCGMELNDHNLPLIRARVGVIFQNPDDQLFSPSVYEDVAYGPYYQGLNGDEIEQRVNQALQAVGMQAFARRHPFHLSGGEKKRVAIATVLSMQPSVLVFDEPTSGLDPRARRELLELLSSLPQTMLIATHDLDFVSRLTTRSIVLNQGKITADQPTAALLHDEQFLYQNGLR